MMLKMMPNVVLMLLLVPVGAWADPASQQALQARLAPLQQFTTQFTQTVSDLEGEPLYTAEGEMSVQRPSRFRWHTRQPDEELIVADGDALWVYNPFVEQVTVLDQQQAISESPLLLLTSDDPATWAAYDVSRRDNTFVISSQDANSNIARFTLTFNDLGDLASFHVSERQGQTSEFVLSDFERNVSLDESVFHFSVPEGVTVDDQR